MSGFRHLLLALAAVAAWSVIPAKAGPPTEPMVIEMPEIGKRGGELQTLIGRTKDVRLLYVYGHARLVGYDTELNLVPDILADFDVKDGRIFTFKLREGHKWSDGEPFTSEDLRFFWQDVALNEELRPTGPPIQMVVDGEIPKFEVIDEVTVRYTWEKPNPFFIPIIAAASPLFIYAPSHYLKRFHKSYVDSGALDAMVEEDNARDWAQLFLRQMRMNKFDNPDLPTLQPWMLTTPPPAERFIAERNPNYHRVDANGEQLPYIDRLVLTVVDTKLVPVKTGAGETDLQSRGLFFKDYTFLKESEARNGLAVSLWPQARSAHLALYPNLNAVDTAWRKLFRSQSFREAIAIAIDRSAISAYLYYGLAVPSNNTILDQSPLHRLEYDAHCVNYDVDRANALLDELGLIERDDRGIRLLPDGRPLELIVETAGEDTEQADILELVADDWRKIGFAIHTKPSEREVLRNRVFAGEALMTIWYGIENGVPTADTPPDSFVPINQYEQLQWSKWGQHYETKGASGEAPDMDSAIALMDYYQDWIEATNTDERVLAWDNILKTFSSECYTIGLVKNVMQPIAKRNNLRNVPDEAIYNWEPHGQFGIYRPDTFWLADEN